MPPSTLAQDSLAGAFYGFENSRLNKVLKSQGYQKMPKYVLHEDLWLSILIGRGRFVIDDKAKVYVRPSSWSEEMKMQLRMQRGIKQLKEMIPKQFEEYFPSSVYAKALKIFGRLRMADNSIEKLHYLSAIMVNMYMSKKAKKALESDNFDNPLSGWETSLHSKDTKWLIKLHETYLSTS